MSNIVASAERVLKWLTDHDRKVVEFLQKGLTDQEIETFQDRFGWRLPAEVVDLFQWRNGTNIDGTLTLDESYFYPEYVFISAAEALERAEGFVAVMNDPQLQGLTDWWKTGWLPMFDSVAGDYMVVDCSRSDGASAPIVGFVHPGDHIMDDYFSLSSMMEILAVCCEHGAFYLDAEGFMTTDYNKQRAIVREFNPGGVPPGWE